MPAASSPGRVRGSKSAAARLVLAAILLAATAAPRPVFAETLAAGAAGVGAARAGAAESAGSDGAAPRYFASDRSGFPGAAIAAPPASGYALAVETAGNEERRILLKDGLEIERRVRVKGPKGTVERLFRGATLVEETKSGLGGELLEELFYGEAERGERLRERRSYVYSAGRLARVEASDGEGQSLGGLEYRYDPRGRLLEIRATGSFGAERSGTAPAPAAGEGGGLGLEWSERGGELAIRRYDAEGRSLLAELRRDGTLLRRETFSYAAGSRSPRSSLVEELETRERVETSYGARGEILATRRLKEGVEVFRTEYGYDSKGRLLFEQTWRGASLARRSLEYDEAGEPRREERWKDGALVAVALLEAPGLRVEELYDGGQLVLRVYYEGGRKVKEEFIEGGFVRRTREYR